MVEILIWSVLQRRGGKRQREGVGELFFSFVVLDGIYWRMGIFISDTNMGGMMAYFGAWVTQIDRRTSSDFAAEACKKTSCAVYVFTINDGASYLIV
jgi:hypothetical protein